DGRCRAGGGGDERLDVLGLDADAAADRRLEQRLGAVERDHPIGELERQIAGLDAERALEAELRSLTDQREVEVLDAVRRRRLPFAARDVRDDAFVDLHLRDDRGGRAAGPAAARPSGPRSGLGLGRRREGRHVQAAVGALDERDAGPFERDVAELHPAAEQRTELEIDPTGRVKVQYSSMSTGVVVPSTTAPVVSSTV